MICLVFINSFALVLSAWSWPLTGRREERFSLFDDIRREFPSAAGADVPRRVDRSGRDEQDVAGLEGHRRLALQRVFPRAFEDIDDLFARMRVPRGRRSRLELDDRRMTSRPATLRSCRWRSMRRAPTCCASAACSARTAAAIIHCRKRYARSKSVLRFGIHIRNSILISVVRILLTQPTARIPLGMANRISDCPTREGRGKNERPRAGLARRDKRGTWFRNTVLKSEKPSGIRQTKSVAAAPMTFRGVATQR